MFAAITGFGCICAAGTSLSDVMTSLYSGVRSPKPATRVKAELEKLPPLFEIADDLKWLKASKDVSRTNLLLLASIEDALRLANITKEQLKEKRVGVIIGNTVGCTIVQESFYRDYRDKDNPHSYDIFQGLTNNPALFISKEYSLSGPSTSITNACSSGKQSLMTPPASLMISALAAKSQEFMCGSK